MTLHTHSVRQLGDIMNSGLMGSSWVLGFPGEDEPSQKSEDVST